MKALILAAGYGTRLYPLTENTPKPLLPIAGKPIIEYIIEKINAPGLVDKIYIITNDKFFRYFQGWAEGFGRNANIEIINDGTTSENDRLGTIGDIHFAVRGKEIDDDLLIIGGDNIFTDNLDTFIAFARSKSPASSIGVVNLNDLSAVKRFGVVEFDSRSKVTGFQEKPEKPTSSFVSMCLYYFPECKLGKFSEYLASGNHYDAMGHFITWLSKADEVYGCGFTGEWFDIGDKQAYYDAEEYFANIKGGSGQAKQKITAPVRYSRNVQKV